MARRLFAYIILCIILITVAQIQLASSVAVQEDYIDVKIESFSIDRTTINPDETANINVTLKNYSPFSGTVAHGISVPQEVDATCFVIGGSGEEYFYANQTKNLTLKIDYSGLLAEDKNINLTYKITNDEPRTTDERTFTITLKAGLGIPDTVIEVKAFNSDTKESVGYVDVDVNYGLNLEEFHKSNYSNNGQVTVNLGKYTGLAEVIVSSNHRYEPQNLTVNLNNGITPLSFELVPTETIPSDTSTDNNWFLIGIIIIVAVALLVGIIIGSHRGGKFGKNQKK